MSFTLRWKNDNPAGSVVKVYRGTAKLNPTALPAPLATLSNGEETWTDTTVLLNTGYYYLLTVTVNDRTAAGPQKYIVVKNRRGVGSVDQINMFDTDDLAFLGSMDFTEQWSADDFPAGFRALVGVSGPAQLSFHKFSQNGRMKYMFPNGGRYYNKLFSWNDIYNAGLMYGVDGPGPENGRGNLAPVDQNGLFDFQGDTYRMRCLRGLTLPNESTVMTLPDAWHGVTMTSIGKGRCEYNDLVYPYNEFIPESQPIPNWYQLQNYQMFSSGGVFTGTGYLCQERDPVSGKVVSRGSTPSGNGASLQIKADLEMIKLVDPAVANGVFVPVIELME
ncbi:putative virion structural protein [Erwinia phage pEa_SNUABM_8]|nr:putative virion structural protein [Erwinia phage pEa_SNUABM_8]QVW54924.1 hypothetical protein pEaSNUABM4_00171 [Erwinia phage pEa_SNUABM_4]